MANQGIPVNRAIITWARMRAGFTLEEAAEKFARIAAWEAGEALPTYPQLERLAEEFKLPVAAFFFPVPPELPPIRESFRTLPDTEFDQIPRQVRFLLRKAKALQLNLIELTQGRNPARRLITSHLRFAVDVPISRIAAEVRDYLGISLERQVHWADEDTALRKWRQALQDAPYRVFGSKRRPRWLAATRQGSGHSLAGTMQTSRARSQTSAHVHADRSSSRDAARRRASSSEAKSTSLGGDKTSMESRK